MTTGPRGRRARGGFSAVEMAVVSALTAMLAAVLGAVWTAFCFPALEVAARCELTLEANLAAASLARDCGGYLDTIEGRSGSLDDFRYDGCEFVEGDLRVKFQGTSEVIVYRLDGDRLVRSVGTEGPWTTVAAGLVAFEDATEVGDPGLAVRLTFRNQWRHGRSGGPDRALVASYVLVTPAVDALGPPPATP